MLNSISEFLPHYLCNVYGKRVLMVTGAETQLETYSSFSCDHLKVGFRFSSSFLGA